jgi:hypothetical protein
VAKSVQFWQLDDGRVFSSREEAEAVEADGVDSKRAELFAQQTYPDVGAREQVRVRNVALEFMRWERKERGPAE